MNKAIAVVVAILIIAGGGYWFMQNRKQTEQKPAESAQMDEQKQPESEKTEPAQEAAPKTEAKESPVVTTQEITMTTGRYFFDPKEITLTKGRPVKITIQSDGHHTFTIDDLGVNQALESGTTVVEFTPQQAGIFQYYCAVPGHRAQGQFGTVTVEE